MPQLVVAVGGAVIGGLVSGGALAAIQIGFLVGTIVGMALFPTTIEGPRTTDFRISDSSYKVPIPRVYVAGRVAGNVIQAGPVVQVRSDRKIGIGSKISEYQNFRTFAVQLCEGEIITVLRIWANDELIYDERAHETDLLGARGTLREGIKRKFDFQHTVYTGSEDQQPDPDMEDVVGAGNQPAYRGTAYIVFKDFPLSEFNDQMPRFQFEVVLADDVWTLKDYDPIIDGEFPNDRFRALLTLFRDDARPYLMYGILFQDQDDLYVTDPNRKHVIVKFNAWTGEIIASRELTYLAPFTTKSPQVPMWCAPITRPPYGPYIFAVQSAQEAGGATMNNSWVVAIDPETLRVVKESATPNEAGFAPPSGQIPYSCDYLCASPLGQFAWALFRHTGLSDDRGHFALYDHIARRTVYYTGVQLGCPAGASYQAWVWDDSPFVLELPGNGLWAAYQLSGILYLDRFLIGGGDPSKFATYTVGTIPISLPYTIVGLTFVPSTREILCWIEQSSQVGGRMIRFSLETLGASSDWFTYTNLCSFSFEGAYSAQWADKASGQWTDRAIFVGGELESHLLIDDGLYLFNAETGEETYYPFSLWGSNFPSGVRFDWISNLTYEPYSEVIWGNWLSIDYTSESPFLPVEEGLQRWFIRRADADTGVLSSILNDLLSDAPELTSADYDFANQTQLTRGFTVDNRMTLRNAIDALKPAYFFDIVESDWQLKGKNRGQPVLVTIEDDHLGASEDPDARVERLTVTRVNEQELPAWIDYGFFDVGKDYLSNTLPARRPGATMNSDNVVLVDVPVVMNAQEASDAGRRMMATTWAGREMGRLSTWLYYLSLEPGDSFRVLRNGRSYRFRVTKLTVGANYVLEIEGTSENDEVSAYERTGTPPDVSGFVPAELATIYPPKLYVADTALLRDEDNSPGIYVGAGPALLSDEWRGALVSRSASIDSGFTQVAALEAATVMGYAVNEMLDPSDWTQWDRDSVLVVMLDGEQTLTSSTEDRVLDDYKENLFALSNPEGGHEICQFVSAVQSGTREWTLSTFLRGRLGTEQHRAGHTFGDRFALLTETGIAPANYAASEIGATRYYKATGSGVAGDGPVEQVVQTTRRLLPYAPFDVNVSRDGSGNIMITWIRRSRSPGPFLWPAPLFEDEEAYQVVITDLYADVRTIDATSESASYTAAEQLADFGSLRAEGTLDGRVYQISNTVGRGYPAEFENL